PCSPLTGGNCKARQRLAESLFYGLMHQSGQRLQQQVPPAWHWHGRAVKIEDGSGVSMTDTAANQQAYPPPTGHGAVDSFRVLPCRPYRRGLVVGLWGGIGGGSGTSQGQKHE